MTRVLVEVALPLPLDQTFTYSIVGRPAPPLGSRVLVPFRQTERIGWVVGIGEDTADALAPLSIRSVLSVLDETPSVSPELLRLARWVGEYYIAPLGISLRSALPGALSDISRDYVVLGDGGSSAGGADPGESTEGMLPGMGAPALTARQARLLEALTPRPQRVRTLRKTLDMGSFWPEIRALEAAGLLRHETVSPRPPSVRTRKVVAIKRWLVSIVEQEELFARAVRQQECYDVLAASGGAVELAHLTSQHGFSRAVVSGLEDKGIVHLRDDEIMRDPFRDEAPRVPPDLHPNPAQRKALEALTEALDEERPLPFLLHGITGSGKTLVYIELLKAALEQGKGAIVLVPEIALTPQTVSRFRAHFGDLVAVLHSGLSDGERYDAWRQLQSGEKRIAVGARSAIFAPIADLGAIVVDEEHDGSYKQSEAPRYHARDIAVVRAAFNGAVCVLGSATPSIESWSNAQNGKFTLLTLPLRATGGPLPPVRAIDLREVKKSKKTGVQEGHGEAGMVLSPDLVEAVRDRIRKEEQVILLLNRRGYSSFVQCRDCGDVTDCDHCSISLTYHRLKRRLVCHHCRYEEAVPDRCAQCGSKDLSFRGLGTEQVERSVSDTFPGVRMARMDVDTTSGKWSHHEILGRVERGEVDILLGTQMIAKGLDFPRVTLVGVINADIGIHMPDFRASERTFQLLSQVAGRTGRGPLGGEVLIQTSIPEHYAIQAALTHDFRGFAEREMKERASPAYPPFLRLVNVVLSSPDPEAAARGAEEGASWIKKRLSRKGAPAVEIVGPAPCPIERLHGRWRWHFLLRGKSPRDTGMLAHDLAANFRPTGSADIRIAIDRDPAALM